MAENEISSPWYTHFLTETSSYSTSERLLEVLTVPIFSVDCSIFPHLSTSSLKCSSTTLAWQLRTVIVAPSLIVSSCSFLATKITQPYWSPTRTSAYLIIVPSYLLLSLIILMLCTYLIRNKYRSIWQKNVNTLRCMLTLVPGSRV